MGLVGTWRDGHRDLRHTWAPSTFPLWRPWWSVATGEASLTLTITSIIFILQFPDRQQVPLLLHAARAPASVSHLPQTPGRVDQGDPV